jgi:hypothetical protein
MTIKICNNCKIEKPFSEFAKNKQILLGFVSTCKKCRNTLYFESNNKNRTSENGFLNNKISDIFTPSNVRKRGFVPECTKDEIKKYFYKYVEKHGRNCFYCKEPWTYIVNDYIPNSNNKTNGGKGISRKNKIKNFSIDRIDSFKTYSISNIIFCCWACNLSKKDISIKLIKRLYEIITERNL